MFIDNTQKILRNIEQTATTEIAKIDSQTEKEIVEIKKYWADKEVATLSKFASYEANQKERFLQHHASKVAIETQKRELLVKNKIYSDVLQEVTSAITKDSKLFIEACLARLPKTYVELQIPVWASYKGAKSILPENDFRVIAKVSECEEFECSLQDLLVAHNNEIMEVLYSENLSKTPSKTPSKANSKANSKKSVSKIKS